MQSRLRPVKTAVDPLEPSERGRTPILQTTGKRYGVPHFVVRRGKSFLVGGTTGSQIETLISLFGELCRELRDQH